MLTQCFTCLLPVLPSIPQEDSDYERERTPPTPPPRKPTSSRRSGAAFKLACIGKQNSDEMPMMRNKNIAVPLKLAQTQVSCFAVVVGRVVVVVVVRCFFRSD